jgi:hypothetical protein
MNVVVDKYLSLSLRYPVIRQYIRRNKMTASTRKELTRIAIANYLKRWFGVAFSNRIPKDDLDKIFLSHADCIISGIYYYNKRIRDRNGRFLKDDYDG